jgi:hypothetical protein
MMNKKTYIKRLILLIRSIIIIGISSLLYSCPTTCYVDPGCDRNFSLSGTVLDQSSNPVVGAEVYMYDPRGNPTSILVTTTDASGKYTYNFTTYTHSSNNYLFFRKSGFQDLSTNILADRNADCGNFLLVRDGVMVP